MKSCRNIKEQISLYVDAELDEIEKKAFEEHVKGCESCSGELEDILCVVRLCAEVEDAELPVNFRSELHAKLLDAQAEKDFSSKNLLKRKYFGILASIAAVLLIAFLFKGIIIDGYFFPARQGAESSPMAAGDAAGEAAEGMIAMGEAEENGSLQGESPNGDSKAPALYSASRSADSSIESRTGEVLSKFILNSMSTSLNIISNNPRNQLEKIKELALKNGGEPYEPSETEAKSDLGIQGDIQGDYSTKLYFKIPNSQYEAFQKELSEYYGPSNVQLLRVESKDESEEVEELNVRLAELDNKLSAGQTNAEEASAMQKERENVANKIEEIYFDTDYNFVTISFEIR